MIRIAASLVCGMLISSVVMADVAHVSKGLDIYYQKSGQGDIPVVLVPGWMMSSEVFERQLKFFSSSKDFTIYAIDPRSQGRSSKTSDGNFYEQHGQDIGDFVATLGLKNVVLAGWSNGGFDILSYVHQFKTTQLAGLVMIDAAPQGSGQDNTKDWVWFNKDDSDGYRQYFTQQALLHRDDLNNEFAKWMVENPTPEYMSWIKKISSQTSDEVAAILNESSAYQDYSGTLKALEGKVSLLYFASADKYPIVKRWAGNNTPSAQVIEFPKHLSFWERDAEFNKALSQFLNQIKTSVNHI
ncbi:alpha/beta hydrolase [Pseudomonas putida]|uniref:alpha/beta fold hydrolase n=1 Tax=Pseudomonas putida TaxID=303 RepID=UPI00335315D9